MPLAPVVGDGDIKWKMEEGEMWKTEGSERNEDGDKGIRFESHILEVLEPETEQNKL